MVTFAGVSHVALTVTDLDVSEAFTRRSSTSSPSWMSATAGS